MAIKWIVLVTLFALTFAQPDKRDPYDEDDHDDDDHGDDDHGDDDHDDDDHGDDDDDDDHDDKSHKHGYGDPYGKKKDYSFWYKVKAKDHYGKDLHYGHHEETKPNGRVEGHYHVLLPDTRKLNVWYYVDGYSGFVAKVNYTGDPVYPTGHGYKKSHYKDGSGEHYKEPSGEYKEPSGEYKEPSGEYEKPSKEHY